MKFLFTCLLVFIFSVSFGQKQQFLDLGKLPKTFKFNSLTDSSWRLFRLDSLKTVKIKDSVLSFENNIKTIDSLSWTSFDSLLNLKGNFNSVDLLRWNLSQLSRIGVDSLLDLKNNANSIEPLSWNQSKFSRTRFDSLLILENTIGIGDSLNWNLPQLSRIGFDSLLNLKNNFNSVYSLSWNLSQFSRPRFDSLWKAKMEVISDTFVSQVDGSDQNINLLTPKAEFPIEHLHFDSLTSSFLNITKVSKDPGNLLRKETILDQFSIPETSKSLSSFSSPFQNQEIFPPDLESFLNTNSDGIPDDFLKELNLEEGQSLVKRLVSLSDRDILDSLRTLAAKKLYETKEEVQDSLTVFLISEKESLKDNLFFEGIINSKLSDSGLSLEDFSASLGIQVRKVYQVGIGPEIGMINGDFSTLGARVFAKREILQNRLFAVVENSMFKGNLPGVNDIDIKKLNTNWKIGAATLLNLTPSGQTKLNLQTLFNPDYFNNSFSNLFDLRFGISKYSLTK